VSNLVLFKDTPGVFKPKRLTAPGVTGEAGVTGVENETILITTMEFNVMTLRWE